MNTIGFFRREGDEFVGQVQTLSLDAAVRLTPTDKVSSKAPDYVALRGQAECGAAWKVSDAPGVILNLKLDDPAWPEPINARLMAAQDEALPLTWIRRTDPPIERAPPAPSS